MYSNDMYRISCIQNGVVVENTPLLTLYNSGEELYFNIGLIFTRRSKEDINTPKQWELVNGYLNYKGDEYKKKLFTLYKGFMSDIDELVLSSSDNDFRLAPPYNLFADILSMIDVEDIRKYLVEVKKINVPSSLADSFDMTIETDNLGSREQTFIKSEYVDLSALIVYIKLTYPIVLKYVELLSACDDNSPNVVDLFQIYKYYDPVYECAGMNKLKDFVGKLIFPTDMSADEINALTIELVMSPEEMIPFRLSQLVIQKLPFLLIVDDNDNLNIIKTIYKFLSSKLKTQYGSGDLVKQKHVLKGDGESGGESHMESYKIVGDVREGQKVFLNVCFDTLEFCIRQLRGRQLELMTKPIEISLRGEKFVYTVDDIKNELRAFDSSSPKWDGYYIKQDILIIMSTIFKSVVDPRYVDYLNLESTLNQLTLSFMYLWNLGYQDLALMLVSCDNKTQNKYLSINTSTNKNRVDDELSRKLEELFPLRRSPTKTNSEGDLLIRVWIESFCNSYFGVDMYCLAPLPLIEYSENIDSRSLPVSKNLKVSISKFLIENEEIIIQDYPKV